MARLILGCGKHHGKESPDDVLCDIIKFPNVDVQTDLNVTPWPWEDNSFVHVSAEHLVEHLDNLVSFMNECWRVLAPGGSLFLKTPVAGVDPDLEWADPTHKRCYRIHTFANYFSPEGVEQFGYTNRAWNFFVLRAVNCELIVHGYPTKK